MRLGVATYRSSRQTFWASRGARRHGETLRNADQTAGGLPAVLH